LGTGSPNTTTHRGSSRIRPAARASPERSSNCEPNSRYICSTRRRRRFTTIMAFPSLRGNVSRSPFHLPEPASVASPTTTHLRELAVCHVFVYPGPLSSRRCFSASVTARRPKGVYESVHRPSHSDRSTAPVIRAKTCFQTFLCGCRLRLPPFLLPCATWS